MPGRRGRSKSECRVEPRAEIAETFDRFVSEHQPQVVVAANAAPRRAARHLPDRETRGYRGVPPASALAWAFPGLAVPLFIAAMIAVLTRRSCDRPGNRHRYHRAMLGMQAGVQLLGIATVGQGRNARTAVGCRERAARLEQAAG